jgi:rhodanese-related sulfurtransferase
MRYDSFMKHIVWVVLLTLFLASCTSGIIPISPAQLDKLNSDTYTLVNVQVPYAGEILQTEMYIPYTEADQLNLPKDELIIVYCKGGRMSQTFAEDLIDLGYTNVMHLTGGLDNWANTGREILQGKGIELEVE